MVVSMAVIPRDTRAGTARRSIQKQHHERTTNVTAGVNTDETKYSRRRLNEKTTVRLAKEPAIENVEAHELMRSCNELHVFRIFFRNSSSR